MNSGVGDKGRYPPSPDTHPTRPPALKGNPRSPVLWKPLASHNNHTCLRGFPSAYPPQTRTATTEALRALCRSVTRRGASRGGGATWPTAPTSISTCQRGLGTLTFSTDDNCHLCKAREVQLTWADWAIGLRVNWDYNSTSAEKEEFI